MSNQGLFNKFRKQSEEQSSSCFLHDCKKQGIKAHSISKGKILKKISTDGHVLYFNPGQHKNGIAQMTRSGINKKASIFPGMCAEHDNTVYTKIDTLNYTPNNLEQEFLFAMRACAREFNIRTSTNINLRTILNRGELNHEGKEFMKFYIENFEIGTQEIRQDRTRFSINYNKQRFWKIRTLTIEIKYEIPIAVSSQFKLERGINNEIINNLILDTNVPKMMYLTMFPQSGKTLILLSYRKEHQESFESLAQINQMTEKDKEIIISNIITNYCENLVINEEYWDKLGHDIQKKFYDYRGFGQTKIAQPCPIIIDKSFNLFNH